jgi:hypothetical protein
MSEFLYLYRSSQPRGGSPEEMQQTMQKWLAWMKTLADGGHLKEPGQPLEAGGKVVADRADTITDGPYVEKDLVCGYTIIEASDLDQAAKLSAGCPIYEYGGFVEVRPIIKMER